MADMIPVFGPDWQCDDDTTGAPVAGGSLTFYNAGTTDARVVYSDPGLTASLGNVVSLNAAGRPVSGSSLVTIYTGVNAFKVVVKDSDGTTLRTHDNLPGAYDTLALAETGDVTGLGTGYVATQTISGDDTAVAGDEGHVFNVDPSGGTRTFTLPSAAAVGDGWPITVRHDGTANAVKIATVSSQVIQHAGVNTETLSLTERGESVTLVSDATSWIIAHHSIGGIVSTVPQLVIEAIQASPPGSPTPGQTYIIASTPSGGWSARAEHDVARWSGGEWLYWTPPTDSGWTAYNKDNNTNYQLQASAWVALIGSAGSGLSLSAGAASVVFADAADMEAATETDEAVPPVLQHRHPGHPKAWGDYTMVGTANWTVTSPSSEYGMSSFTDSGTGTATLGLDTAFSNTGYAAVGSVSSPNTQLNIFGQISTSTKTTTSVQFLVATINTSTSAVDAPANSFALFGDQ